MTKELDIQIDKKDIKDQEAFENNVGDSNKPKFLISTDSFLNAGLDMIFDMVKSAGFDGIDLAIWKNFDSRNVDYVSKISKQHDLPINIIQVSENINQKELDKALDLCEATGADTITINAPKFFNVKSYNFLVDNIDNYKKQNKHIRFSIINPEDSSIFALPIPKYHFTNIVDIIKKYSCYLGLDIANIDTNLLETELIKKLPNLIPYISTIYFSDKSRTGQSHIMPGEGNLRLATILKKIKQTGYNKYFSTKININKAELADSEKLTELLIKARRYYTEHFENIEIEI